MHPPLALIVPLIPLGPLLAALAASGAKTRNAVRLGRLGASAAVAAASAAAAGFVLGDGGSWHVSLRPAAAPWSFAFHYDAVTAIVTLVVAVIGWTVARFSRAYLHGEPREAAYHRALALTLAAALLVLVAGNLVLLWTAWVLTSLGLHRLLLQYPDRPGAQLAARRKAVVSRLAHVTLAAGFVLLWHRLGTGDVAELLQRIPNRAAGDLAAPALLIALGAAITTVQFPFHTWLPDTMETPTPVSALMHAGIVNAGGYLLVRFAPLLERTPGVADGVAILGGVTAAYGALVMLTQPSVKRALAYSTIAQMGFMFVECGLGAYGLALLHLAAHSVYKAHAFLTSGSSVGAVPRAAVPLSPGALIAGLAGGAVAAVGYHTAAGSGASAALALVFGSAVAYGLARLWSVRADFRFIAMGVGAAAVFGGVALALHRLVDAIVEPISAAHSWVVALLALMFALLFIVQAVVWRLGAHALGRRLYVHALNGFYAGALFDRAFGRFRPAARVS